MFSPFFMRKPLETYLPENAIGYCIHLSSNYNFQLDFSFNRKSKFGHYKYVPQTNTHIISINKGLSKPLFLVTFIHELAHLDVMIKFKRKAKPHGQEWKNTFASFLSPLLNDRIFEPALLNALTNHLKKPKATLSADHELWKLLIPNEFTHSLFLKDIDFEDYFIFNQRIFRKLKTRRTRALCLEPATGKQFLIPLIAPVKKAS